MFSLHHNYNFASVTVQVKLIRKILINNDIK